MTPGLHLGVTVRSMAESLPSVQNVLSIKGCQYWNELPVTLREIPTFTAFKGQLKQWLKNNQSCDHV